jgi:hypothetical protein
VVTFVRVGDNPDTERDSLPRDDSVGTKAVAGGGRFARPTPLRPRRCMHGRIRGANGSLFNRMRSIIYSLKTGL